MKTSSSLKLAIAGIAALAVSAAVSESQAATQGTLGATSTGVVNVNVTKTQLAKISSLTDLTLPSWQDGNGDVNLSENVCVYSTRPNGGYTVNATGSGASSAFTLASGSSTLAYNVLWNSGGVANPSGGTASTLTSNVTSGKMLNAATDSSSCTGATAGPTAALTVNIPNANMQAATDGAYSGTLTLLVTPN